MTLRLKQVCKAVGQYGANIPASEYVNEGVRFLRTTDIKEDGRLTAPEQGVYVTGTMVPDHILESGDLLFSRSGTLGRAYLHSDEAESLSHSFAGYLVRFRPKQGVFPKFIFYASRSASFLSQIDADAIQTTIANFNAEKYGNIRLWLPPLPTQKAIAAFLDRKTAAIDALIEKKQKLLDLLAEKRAALINQAVTKGLDPNVPMKDSGIPWIGEIPAHWEVKQARRVIRSLCDGPFGSGLKSQHYTDDGVRVIRLQNIRSGHFDNTNQAFISKEHFRSLAGHEARPGDLLIAGLGDTNNPVGRACVLPDAVALALVKADCYRARLDERMTDHQYVAEYLSSAPGTAGMLYVSRGATRTRINLEIVRDAWLTVPPILEQRRIAAHCVTLREMWAGWHRTIGEQIERLQEYRQALITAAVTGQLDIPEEDV